MRDIKAILKLFAKEYTMNYCKDFDVVKGILEYTNDYVKPLERVQFRGGNEHVIEEISERLQKHFISSGYVDVDNNPLPKHERILQKITLFLVLNTDVTYKYNLKDDPHLSHVLDLCPQLSKFLLVSVIWETKLDKFFYQLLACTPCWFSFQYFEPAINSLKHIDEPYDVLNKVEHLVKAIFTSITRSELRTIDTVDKKIIFGKFYDYSMDLLRQFYTPDAEKFKSFSKNEFFKYSGYALLHLLDMLLFCFDGYEQKTEPELNESNEIFDIFTTLCPKVGVGALASPSDLVKESQLKIITALLNSLQYNVCLITIHVFMYWVEVDLNENETLQSAVGERAYNVLERMDQNKAFGHDIDKQLRSIAIRPKTQEEILKEATLGDILRKLDEEEVADKRIWLDELFERSVSEGTLGNDECLETIRSNLKLVSPENCEKILEYVRLEYLERECGDEENESMDEDNMHEELFGILTSALPQFSTEQLIRLISLEISKFGERTKIAEQENFSDRCTEFFNKFSNSFDLHTFLCLCFENPHLIWAKFFDEACVSDEHVRNFCATVKATQKFSKIYFNEVLSSFFFIANLEEKFTPNLICEIYFELFFDKKTEFFKTFVNKNVNEMLEAERWTDLLVMVKALNLIANRPQIGKALNFGEVTAPVLLMTAQIMEKCRWDLISYSDEKDEILRGAIDFVQLVSKKFLPVATEKDKKWINKTKESYRPITQYYFQKYSLTLGEQPKTFDKFLIPMQIQDKSEAQMFLIINYVRCTAKETEWLAKSDRLLPHISDMILILGGVVMETGKPIAIRNYRHCMVNYANIVRKFLIPQIAQKRDEVAELGLKLLRIIQSAPEEIYGEIFLSFEELLIDVFKQSPVPIDEELVNDARSLATSMKDCKGKEIFLQKFAAVCSEI